MSEDENGKKNERYNTVFLVSQIQDSQARNKKIGIAVAVAIVLVLLYFLFIKEPGEPIGAVPPPASLPASAPASAPTAPTAPTAPVTK